MCVNYCCQWHPKLRAKPHEHGLSGSKTLANSSLNKLVILFLKVFIFRKSQGRINLHRRFHNLKGEKLNYKSVAVDSRFLQMFRSPPIFGMSRDHNRKRLKLGLSGSFLKYNNSFCPKQGIIYNL